MTKKKRKHREESDPGNEFCSPTCSEFESGTSPQEFDSTCAPMERHQSMHLMACSRLPFPSAFMNRQGMRVAA